MTATTILDLIAIAIVVPAYIYLAILAWRGP